MRTRARQRSLMINPYEPPSGEPPNSTYLKRLRRAFSMAGAEYRAGLRRDGFTTWSHLHAWLGLILTALLLLLFSVGVIIVIVLKLFMFN